MIPVAPQISLAHKLILALGPRALLDRLTPEERRTFRYARSAWERPSARLPTLTDDDDLKEPGWGRWTGQQEPPGRWLYWILCAGRGFGKSWVLSNFCINRAEKYPGSRTALVGCTANSLWSDCVLGESGIMELAPPWFYPTIHKTGTFLSWPNGSITRLFTAEEPKRLKGPNNDFGAVEELCAQSRAQDVWDELQFTLRMGELPQTIVATTPDPPIPILLELIQHRSSAVTIGCTTENKGNVSEAWLQERVIPLLDTHVGQQQLKGKIILESPGALFKRAWFDRAKWCPDWMRPSRYKRIGVGVDPARTSGHKADSWGIIKAAHREDGLYEVMVDATVNDTPDVAIHRAVQLYFEEPAANFMVADKGAGGQMVDALVRLAGGRGVNVLTKQGNRSKRAWAEGASVLYARHLVFNALGMPDLEKECCTWTDDTQKSPNRMDALAYVLAELSKPPAASLNGLNDSRVLPRRI